MTNEEAVEKLKILKEDYWDDNGYGHESKLYDDTTLALDLAIKALEDSRWIPVTERLPKEDGKYLVTRINSDRRRTEVYIVYFSAHYKCWETLDDVTAWMPLPKQYEGSEEE